MKYQVQYHKFEDACTLRTAQFDHLEDAQLFWDSIHYLRNYRVETIRPN